MTTLVHIPLNQLHAWSGNVRKLRSKAFLAELATSIREHGLWQNLVVRPEDNGYAVIAGAQRLKALQQLAEAGDIPAGHPVPCVIHAGEIDPAEISLVENVMRDGMHPADQFAAFRALIDGGAAIADVAARFSTTETVVRQRLKLARVHASILAAYRRDKLTLDQVMAFAVTDDQAAQKTVFDGMTPWTNARGIRAALTEHEVSAEDRRVQFVTLKAYRKAGGTIRRDLFSEGDAGVFIEDVALLDQLAAAKLARGAATVHKEGWSWIEVQVVFDTSERGAYQRRQPALSPLPEDKAAELAAFEAEYNALESAWMDNEDDERPERMDDLADLIEAINDSRSYDFDAETLAIGGAIVSIGYDGKLAVDRGLIRREDVPKPKPKAQTASEAGEDPAPALSASLIEDLTTQQSAALSAELKDQPGVALAAVVHAMVLQVFFDARGDSALQISISTPALNSAAESAAMHELEQARSQWGERLPGNPDDLWTWCLEAPQDTLLALLAYCAARSVNLVKTKHDRDGSPRLQHGQQLARAASLDMNDWFTPLAANYFGRLSKAQIIDALTEARQQPPAPAWLKLGKAELAERAEREIGGTGWLPEPLRRAA